MLAIALALGASVCWGTGDFCGGLGARRASLWTIIIGSQAVGLAGAALVTLAAGAGWPGLHAVWPVLAGGVFSVAAISCFYRALAIGVMSVVAPITAANALIPFAAGLAGGERPTLVQLGGVALIAVGVVLVAVDTARGDETIGVAALPGEPAVEPAGAGELFAGGRAARAAADGGASSPHATDRGDGPAAKPDRAARRRAVLLALAAAVCLGLVLVAYDMTARHSPLWAMLGGRISSTTLFLAIFLVLRPRLRAGRAALPFVVAIGVLDTGANGLFALATTQGYLSLVAVLGSLYPVVTVLLAYAVLRERIARHQVAGAVATLAGVALIAAA